MSLQQVLDLLGGCLRFLVLLFSFSVATCVSREPARPAFDETAWKQAEEYDRRFMAESLVSSGQLIGMDASQLEALLGPASWESDPWFYVAGPRGTLRVMTNRGERSCCWWVGHGLCDDWILDIHLDSNGCVKSAEVHLT